MAFLPNGTYNRLDYYVGESGPHTGNTVGLGDEDTSSLEFCSVSLHFTKADMPEGYHEGSLEKRLDPCELRT